MINALIDKASDILAELTWIQDNVSPEELEQEYDIDTVSDLLKEVSELLGA